MNKRITLTTHTHNLIKAHLNDGDIAVDATVGNGHDMLFLSRQVGKNGVVYGFDIQQQAIEATKSTLETENICTHSNLFHGCHSQMAKLIPDQYHGKIKAIMFNLGYLPGSNKSIITQPDTTLSALNQSVNLLTAGGILTIMAYPGHSGGDIETDMVEQWCKQLNVKLYHFNTIYSSDKKTAPRLITVEKIISTE